MIVVDTSAFVAIMQHESNCKQYHDALLAADKVLISTATSVELYIVVLAKLGTEGLLKIKQLLEQPMFEIVPVDQKQMIVAQQAYERFGKGRHSAKLNYGDLFSYALAKTKNLPLLFKGNDFSKTDVKQVLGK